MKYEIPAIKDLRDQLLYAPEKARRQQVERLETLVHEITPDREYPYDYIVFRITNFRPERARQANLHGSAVHRDLARLLLDLSNSVNIPVSAAGEPVFSLDDAADLYRVSPRTICRWQANGLVGQRFIFPDAQKKVGFRKSCLDRYVEANPAAVARSRSFSRMTDAEKERIVRRAKALVVEGRMSLSRVAQALAGEFRRSKEAIRYTVRNFDRRHPEDRIFQCFHKRLSDDEKMAVKRLYDEGTPIRSLSRSFHRTPAAIYAVIHRMQAGAILAEPIEFIPNPLFDRADADEVIFGRPKHAQARKSMRKLSVAELAHAPAHLRHLREAPLLTREQEAALFRRYNYCKFLIAKLRGRLDPDRPSGPLLREILSLRQRALAAKNEIISANLRLVVSIARRHAGPLTSISQLISDGNLSLLNAVEKFDYARGNRFSTYATWALLKNFAKTVPEENYHMNLFTTGHQEVLEAMGGGGPEPFEMAEDLTGAIRDKVMGVLKKLTEREQRVIYSRFGLAANEKPKTLEQIGSSLGITRERVRQIESRALAKLRRFLEPEIPQPRPA